MNLSMEIPTTTVPPGATQPIPPKSTTVKTDKPRPHVCATCTRSFARLEHLKRHERSHTKEKPFKCDVCERCFARRDLLLRHRQKLHASFPESPRVRQTKRKTKKTTAVAAANAAVVTAHQTAQAVGPSVSTPLSLSTMGSLDMTLDSPSSTGTGASPPAMNPKVLRRVQKQTNNNSRPRTMSFSASSSTSYTTHKDIEAWNTNSQWHPAAPPQVGFSTPQLVPASLSDSETNPFEDFFQASDPLFINPQLLGQGHSPDGQLKQSQHQMLEFENNWSGRDIMGVDSDEAHHNGQSWKKEMPANGNNHNGAGLNMHVNETALNIRSQQQQQHLNNQDVLSNMLSPPPTINSGSEGSETNELRSVLGFGLESHGGSNGTRSIDVLQPLDHQHPGFHSSHLQSQPQNGHLIPQIDQHPDQGPENLWDLQQQQQQHGHHQQQQQPPLQLQQQHGTKSAVSVAGSSSHVITPQLRLHVLTTLSSPTPFSSNPPPHLPSTLDLQRYVNSYIENFGKHMPFLHETLQFTAENMPLALGMAAVGALYTYEHANSQAIFEISRCCIHVYLENRRERRDPDNYTPLWLIQSLVLGVVYGLLNGEPMANEIAVAQASAVVSLAKSAGLQMPVTSLEEADGNSSVEDKWQRFVEVQSRIRTMHVIHNICSMLATSYSVTPMLTNDDLRCGCPCDESLWGATTAKSWWEILQQKGMAVKDAMQGKNFGQLFSRLLSGQSLVEYKVPQFTLLSLIYGLHLEIHIQKSLNDDEYQHSSELDREKNWIDHRRPALDTAIVGWETAWTMSPLSTLGANSRYGPIMSDSIPLSQLAHLRTYVDLRRVKESFWKRDYEGMGHALDQLLCISLQDGNPFDSLMESASYAADAISLWSRNSENWSLQTLVSQTFIHSILSLFDCGLVLSEFLNRLEKRETWTSEESQLISRIRKIFYRVADLVGEDGMNVNAANINNNDSGILDIEHSDSARLSVLTLEYVSKILCKSYVWPFALVMGEALRFRAAQIGH